MLSFHLCGRPYCAPALDNGFHRDNLAGLWINDYASVPAGKDLKGPSLLINTAYDLLRVLKRIKDGSWFGADTLRGISDCSTHTMGRKTGNLRAVSGNDAFTLCSRTFPSGYYRTSSATSAPSVTRTAASPASIAATPSCITSTVTRRCRIPALIQPCKQVQMG
jgi:hypothetical protein